MQCSNNSNSISAIQERTEEKNAFLVFHGSNVTYYDIQYILNVEVVNYDVGYDDYVSLILKQNKNLTLFYPNVYNKKKNFVTSAVKV